MITRCPTCRQPLESTPGEAPRVLRRGRRICAKCGRLMLRRHKWFIGQDHKIYHRDCDNPEAYAHCFAELPKAPSLVFPA